MSRFWKVYSKLLLISLGMFALAALCYLLAYRDPKLTDRQVTKLVGQMDSLYGTQAAPLAKRELILNELLQERELGFYRLILEHLAEALILAGVMILTVEGFTRYMANSEVEENNEVLARKFRKQTRMVSRNVWNSIFNRLVPTPIAMEVERILKSQVCRIRPEYTIILSDKDYVDLPPGFIIVRRQLFYRLLNLTGGEVKHVISVRVGGSIDDIELHTPGGEKVTLPRVSEFKIDRKSMPLDPAQRSSQNISLSLPRMESEADAFEIYSEVEVLALLDDRALYVFKEPSYGLILGIVNQVPERVRVLEQEVSVTSGRERLRPTTPQKWVCEGGLLSGTALSIAWRQFPKILSPRFRLPLS